MVSFAFLPDLLIVFYPSPPVPRSWYSCIAFHQDSPGLFFHQVQNRMDILFGAVKRSLPLLKGPSSSVREPGGEQRCGRDTSRVRLVPTSWESPVGLLCCCIKANTSGRFMLKVKPAFSCQSLKSSVISPLYDLILRRDIDEVVNDVAGNAAGDVAVFRFHGPGTRRSNTTSYALVQFVHDM